MVSPIWLLWMIRMLTMAIPAPITQADEAAIDPRAARFTAAAMRAA
jgi:hypothetical protein